MTRLSDLVRPLIASTFVDKTNIEAIASPPLIKDVKDTPSENLNFPAAQKPSTVCADTTEMPILRIHADGSVDSEPEMEVEDDEVLFPQKPEEGEVPIQGEGPPCDLDHPLRQRVLGLPKPITPTRVQREIHELTHLPYETWCEHCVRARAKNLPHRKVKKHRPDNTCPVVSMPFAFLRRGTIARIIVQRSWPGTIKHD